MEVNTLKKQDFMAGGGEMGELIRSIDWSVTPMGNPLHWPQSLRTALSIMLDNSFPMSIIWGNDYFQFYNDAYRPILGATKHPKAMGNSIPDTFPEIWDIIAPLFRDVMKGHAVRYNNFELTLNRYGYPEECYFDFSYSPIRDESGGVGGILATVLETTEKYISDRRLRTLRDMALRASHARSVALARESILLTLEENACDIPFALFYEIDEEGRQAYLTATVRINENHAIARPVIPLYDAGGAVWPLSKVVQTGQPELVSNLSDQFNDLPGGEWPEPAHTACVMPVHHSSKQMPFGILVLGISPRKAFDNHYQDFFTLFAGHAAAAIANAWALESEKKQQSVMLEMRESTHRHIQEERKRIEQSEAWFRRAADSVPVMIWMTAPDGKCIYVNQKWYDYTGQTATTALGKAWIKAVHPDDVDEMMNAFHDANLQQKAFSIEYRIRGADGIYRWMLDSGSPIFDAQHNFEGYIGSVIDIDQRKRSENAVRESELRFRHLADSMPQIVWTANPDGYTDYYNQRWYDLIGHESELGDDSFLKHIHPEDRQRCLKTWYHAVQTGEQYEIEYRFRIKDTHHYRWFLGRAIPIHDLDGQIIKWYGSCTDIDDVKHIDQTIREELEKRVAERTIELSSKNEELRRSEERYVRMTNEVEDYAIILLSVDGYIENWNKGAEKTKGYTADEILGKHFRIFYTEEDQKNKVPESLIEEAKQKGKAAFEGWRVRKDGSNFWAYAVITALHDDKNDIIGFSKVTRDLTERKLAEDTLQLYAEQLEQKNIELERSNSELSAFSYVASHDLQEPLRKIQAFGNLIQNKDAENLSDISRDYFDRMVKAAIRMQNLIDSLLEFSRTATARKNFEETDLNALLDDVKKELLERMEEKKGVIQSGALPVMTVIPFQFRQLLFNLLNNSLKYAREEEQPVIKVNVEKIRAKDMKEKAAQPGQDYYKFSVVDNGIGFEQEYAEKIFELFQRLHGRNEYGGSGIGLAICKKIIENHHGFIRAESEPGKGAAFYFFIPVKQLIN